MAVNVFTLQRALNEAASNSTPISVDAYQFASDDLGTCTNEMCQAIVCEAADYMEHATSTDDMLTECALTEPERFTTLSEGVFATMKTKIKAFFDKIIAMVKGIIDKLKAQVYKITGKTDKWVSLMEPKLRDASGKKGASEFKAEMYKYDEKFILEGLTGGLASMMGDWASKNPVGDTKLDGLADRLKGFKAAKTDVASGMGKGTNADGSERPAVDAASDQAESQVKEFENEADASKNARENFAEKWADQLGGYWGVSGTSPDAVYSELIKKGRDRKSVV